MGIYSVPAKRQGLDLMVSDHKMLNTWDFFLSRIEKKTHYFLVDIRQRKDEWLCYYNAQKDLNGISLTIRKSVKLSLRLKAIIFQVRFPTASSQTVPALVPTPHAQHCNCTRQWEPAPEWAWDIPLATVPLHALFPPPRMPFPPFLICHIPAHRSSVRGPCEASLLPGQD